MPRPIRLRRVARAFAAASFAIAALAAPAGAATFPPDFEARPIATGLNFPVAATWAPDGRIFVAEYRGVVRVIAGGQLLDEPLIDISDHVNAFYDRALLGIAVDSNFAVNHYLYLLYVYDGANPATLHGDAAKTSRLTRVVVRPDNTVANPADPETVILGTDDAAPCPAPSNDSDCIPADYFSHTIGTVRSDADGTLWVGSGDAAVPGQTDPNALRTYDERSFAGKIIHVDRSGRGLPGHPFCPADDDLTHVCTKLHAKGFRNPFRFALRGGSLGPIVGDVGYNLWDEIDLAAAGGNYGWPCWEGKVKNPIWESNATCQSLYAAGGTTLPDFAYPGNGAASAGSNAALGGPVYPGGDYPDSFDGDIMFGDWSHGFIRRLRFPQSGPVVQDFSQSTHVLDLQLAPGGNLAYVSDDGPGVGSVNEIVYCPDNCFPVPRASADPPFGAAPLDVAFRGDQSTDPDGDTLLYDWDFGDGTQHSALPNPPHEYSTDGVYSAKLTVTDTGGLARSASIPISVGNVPPEPSIEAPADEALYTAGEPIQLEGSALDPEEGEVAPEDLEWHVVLHHGSHAHPFTDLTGATATVTPPKDHDVDSFIEATLTARDSTGLARAVAIQLRPRPVDVLLESAPPGAPVVWSSRSVFAPFATTAAAGLRTTVAAATTFKKGGRTYSFQSWSDGGALAHDVTVDANAPPSLLARYRDVTPPPPGTSDTLGPVLTFHSGRADRDAAHGKLIGSARDPAGVRAVEVAVRVPRGKKKRCRWWLAAHSRLAHRRTSCSPPHWIEATLMQREGRKRWRAELGGPLPPRRYEVLFRAVDWLGNVTRAADGVTRAALRVTR